MSKCGRTIRPEGLKSGFGDCTAAIPKRDAGPIRRLVHDTPDEQTAIAKAIEQYDVPANQRGRLIAQRRD
jgi:hypothetical protein